MSQHGQWPCGCGRRDHPPGACPKPMTATEIISRTAEADAAFEDKKAAMMQPLVDRTMEVMRKRGIHVPSDWRIPVAAAKINVEPEIPVTVEMIAAGVASYNEPMAEDEALDVIEIYRAMAALAPSENGVSSWAQRYDDAVQPLQRRCSEYLARIADLDEAVCALNLWKRSWVRQLADKDARIAELEHDIRMLMSDKVGDHDYHGPVKDGKAVPDESHERFHGSIGDVLSGNIIRPARDQMEKALADARAKDGKGVPSIPTGGRSDDPRRIGG